MRRTSRSALPDRRRYSSSIWREAPTHRQGTHSIGLRKLGEDGGRGDADGARGATRQAAVLLGNRPARLPEPGDGSRAGGTASLARGTVLQDPVAVALDQQLVPIATAR